MPWSVAPLRPGRAWVLAPDAATLRARWNALIRAGREAEREALFGPSRSRTLHSAVAPLPGMPAHEGRLVREHGRCPEPVPVLHGPFDQQWLIPDHRLIDAARPQLWRVSDGHQTHLVETAHDHRHPGPLFTFTALLPDGHTPAGRPGRIRPLHRRPGGREPNVLPGLLELLTGRLDTPVTAGDLLAWTAAAARPGPGGRVVPLTADPELWRRGVALGRRVIRLHTRGARCADAENDAADRAADGAGSGEDGVDGARPRLPGGHRPYVRAPLPAPTAPEAGERGYDDEERSLHIGDGRIAPVAPAAWEYEAGGVRVLEDWFAQRTAAPAPGGTLAAVRPRSWPQEWTSELLELITVLTLLDELRPEQRDLARDLDKAGAAGAGSAGAGAVIGRADLGRAGLLPVPAAARRPASVLDVPEEGPDGQLALL
ncbi:DNA methyltransferase [Streptomyces sp. HNM0575]|uniref:type ISP restriction/modification enzyme n=1 Tax=Streptomyces sp. HNM0575 TaxID=2716338 RepID=UPI00145C4D5F|nr:type ISP restriction/modification enzyme [Streptomyces sp. HNM0575]NLU76448.1 DNA methyltransferase [Streptomyces sp. HNM0575]